MPLSVRLCSNTRTKGRANFGVLCALRWVAFAVAFIVASATARAQADPRPPLAPAPAVIAPTKPAPARPKGCRIAVPQLVGRGLSAADAAFPGLLSEVLANEVASASQCQVLSQADIESMVDFEATKSAACSEASDNCLAELGSALGVDRIVAGSIGQLGHDYVITVRLVDIGHAVVEKRAEEVVSGEPEKLRLAAKLVARALFPRDTPLPPIEPPVAAAPPLWTPLFLGGVGAGAVGTVGAVAGGVIAFGADGAIGDPANTHKDDALGTARTGFWIATGSLVVAAVGVGAGVVALLSPDL